MSSRTQMCPSADRLPVSGPTTRKFRPLPPRPSEPQSRDYATYSGIYYRNRTSDASGLSSVPTDSALRRCNTSPKAAPKRGDTVGVQTPSEFENILDHIPPSNDVTANRPIFHDQWKKIGFIGKGSYGQVYQALDITTGYIFAVKEINSKINRKSLVWQALQDERETLKELEHPNIVHYLGFEEDQGVLNIFLEYIPGGTIRSCLNSHGKFKEEVTKSFASQILQGLSYLHSKSILHRDLKSENILVEPRGICKISDFGISKKVVEADKGRLYSTLKGTVAYMAPEMIDDNKKGYDCKIDIWSVGCIVFEMWSGEAPWSGRQDFQILVKLFKEKLAPPLPDDVSLSPTAESFRQEFFHIDPERRPPAVELLQHEYLKLPPQWTFPGVDEIGQVSDTCSKSISPVQKIHPRHISSSHNDIRTGTDLSSRDREEQDSLYETIYSEIQAIHADINFSTANRARSSPSPARTMYSDVMDPRSLSPPIISLTPLRPRKQCNLSNNLGTRTATSNTSNQELPLNTSRPFVIHSAELSSTRGTTSSGYSERQRPYVYHPPPLPELNTLSPYSRTLAPPISIRFNKPVSQAFSKPIKPINSGPTKLTSNHGRISTNLSMNTSSVSSSVARPNLGKIGQREVPCTLPLEGDNDDDDDDDDDDESYSPSIWKRPPMDIPSRPSKVMKPVESISHCDSIPPIHHHHRPLPSAIPRPSVETVYKGFLSKNVEKIDLADNVVARSPISSKTKKSIREVVEERLHQAQIGPAQSPPRAHFWNSHMEEIKV